MKLNLPALIQHSRCRRRRPTRFTMRAAIFLCLLGWAVAAEALTLKCKGCSAASPETTRQRRSNWNPLSMTINVEVKKDESKLNATVDGSNSTTNSSTATEQTNPSSGNDKGKTEEHQAAAPNAAPPNPEPVAQPKPRSFWHPLQSGAGFPPQKKETQAPNAAPPNPQPTVQHSYWHPLQSGAGFPPQKNETQE